MTHNYIGTKEIVAWEAEKGFAPGYRVQYPDGYQSWSPKAVFESAYRVSEGFEQRLTFGDAIHFLKRGRKVMRAGWNGKNMWLELQVPDKHSKMTLPYIYMYTAQGDKVPWLASQTDMLAEDWAVV